jgi:hypothetical protein
MSRRSASLVAGLAVAALAALVTTLVANTRTVAARTGSSADQVKQRLIGTWRLDSFVLVNQKGAVVAYPYGKHPEGKLTYTSNGDVWAYTGQGGAAKSERPGNWYTGAFSIDVRSHTVVHRAVYSSLRIWETTRLIRRYQFAGSRRLTLSTRPAGPEGNKISLVLRWRKVAP